MTLDQGYFLLITRAGESPYPWSLDSSQTNLRTVHIVANMRSLYLRHASSSLALCSNFMTTYDGVRREAVKRHLMEGRQVKIRKLIKSDFESYDTLKLATGIDFEQSDVSARESGSPEEFLAINARLI